MLKKDSYFSKLDSKIIKGLAIILMLIHHLWAFPDRIAGGELKYLFKIHGTSSLIIFGNFGKICVSIFFFISGYGIYTLSKNKNLNLFNIVKKVFINYWKVFLIFIPIGFLFFNNQIAYCESSYIYSIYSNFSIKELIKNFLGISSSLNREWWFLHSYLIAIIKFPLIKKLFENRSTVFNFIIIIIYTIFISIIFPAIVNVENIGLLNNNILNINFFRQSVPYVSCYLAGILFSKDNLMLKLKNRIDKTIKLNVFVDIIGLFTIFYTRQFIFGKMYDIVFIPFLIIFFLDFVNNFKVLSKLFELLGNHSTNIWLIHTFLCYYFYSFVKIIVYLKWGVPCLFILTVLSLLFSYDVNYFWILVNKGIVLFKNIKYNNKL